MRHTRDDVVRAALGVLDRFGLPDLTMRRLAAELGVRPSALYHHVADKQTLLALVADEILRRGARDLPDLPWDARVVATCRALREALLAYRDGAEVVAAAHAFGLGATAPAADLTDALRAAGLDDELARTGARALLHLVLGQVGEEQTRLQAAGAGAVLAGRDPWDAGPPGVRPDVDAGLALLVDGLRVRVAATLAEGPVTGETRSRHPTG